MSSILIDGSIFSNLLMQNIVLLAIAGALGTLSRYGLALLVQRINTTDFPWGTFIINMLGCLLVGVIWELTEKRLIMSTETRFILLVGFMGAFTTFSTFMFESGKLFQNSEWMLLTINIIGQNALGLALIFGGMALGRIL